MLTITIYYYWFAIGGNALTNNRNASTPPSLMVFRRRFWCGDVRGTPVVDRREGASSAMATVGERLWSGTSQFREDWSSPMDSQVVAGGF